MQFNGKRTFEPFMCLLFALLIGMCLGTVPADSFLECMDSDAADVLFTSCSLDSTDKSTPAVQLCEHKSFSQCETALSLRSGGRRNAVRTGRSLGFGLAPADIFSPSALYSDFPASCGFFQEVFSHTVIINYIHRQDGQKASSLSFQAPMGLFLIPKTGNLISQAE